MFADAIADGKVGIVTSVKCIPDVSTVHVRSHGIVSVTKAGGDYFAIKISTTAPITNPVAMAARASTPAQDRTHVAVHQDTPVLTVIRSSAIAPTSHV